MNLVILKYKTKKGVIIEGKFIKLFDKYCPVKFDPTVFVDSKDIEIIEEKEIEITIDGKIKETENESSKDILFGWFD